MLMLSLHAKRWSWPRMLADGGDLGMPTQDVTAVGDLRAKLRDQDKLRGPAGIRPDAGGVEWIRCWWPEKRASPLGSEEWTRVEAKSTCKDRVSEVQERLLKSSAS